MNFKAIFRPGAWRPPRPTLGTGGLLILATLAGCRGDGPGHPTTLEVQLSVAPTPPVTGPARLVFSVQDPEGQPSENLSIRVEGMMSHPGMLPVVAQAQAEGEGHYVIPAFRFPMGGDWILLIRVRLPDGSQELHEKRIRVVSGSPPGSP